MKKEYRSILYSGAILFALLFNAVYPGVARADGGTTATTDTPVATQAPVSTDTPVPSTQAPATTDTSVPSTQAPVSTDTSVSSTQSPVASDTPIPSTPVVTDTVAPATTAAPTDVTPSATDTVTAVATAAPTDATPSATATALTQVLDGMQITVVDGNGTVQPLATQAAADIIATGDPIWCPSGQTPGGAGCTSGYSTVSNLITSGLVGKTATDGTVYFESIYSTNDATFDGSTAALSAWANYKLTIQGGWNGLTGGSYSLSGVTTFSAPVTITNWKNDVTVNDINISGTNTVGLHIDTNGNVKLKNVTSKNNKDTGAYINNSAGSGSVNITNGNFSSNNGEGLAVYSTGDVTLADVTANDNPGGFALGNGISVSSKGNITLNDVIAGGNAADGALLDNTSGIGNINITSSTFSDNQNTGRGLIAHSNGDITLTDVVASGNGGGGAELDNTTGIGSITLSGSNTFNDNGFNLTSSVGLYAVSNSNITLSGVTALGNGYDFGGGAFLGADGSVSIANSNFSENCTTCQLGVGFAVFSMGSGDITLQGVTADNNGNDPANGYTGPTAAVGALIFHNGSNVFVANSDFSGNCALGDCSGGGIEILDFGTGGAVSFDHVTANGNGTSGSGGGAFIASTSNIDINCSTFNNNSGTGLLANVPAGSTITLNGVTLNGNTVSATDISGGGTLVTNTGDCASGNKGTFGLPIHIVNVTGGENNTLDCANYSGTELILPDQDHVLLSCPTTGNAYLTGQSSDKLPGALDNKFTFVSALDAEVTPAFNGSMIVSFKIPSDKQNANFTILHWDGSKWENLGGTRTPDGFFEVQTNQTGTFVLVTQ